jgi:hypothetical protein
MESDKPYRIYWYDDEKTINVLDGHQPWTWADFEEALEIQNKMIAACDYPVYSILISNIGVSPLAPANSSKDGYFQNLARYVRADPQQEELCVFVGVSYFIREMLNLAAKMYSVFAKSGGYRFAATLDDAITLIEAHKAHNQR